MDYRLLIFGILGVIFLLSRISSNSEGKKLISPRKFFKEREPEDIPLVDGLPEMTSKDLVTKVLIKMGCQPYAREDETIVVDIMGRSFVFAFYTEGYWIRISKPYWFRVNGSQLIDHFANLAINMTNKDFGPKIISEDHQNERILSSIFDCIFHPALTLDELEDYLKQIIGSFFTLSESFRQNFRNISGINADII